MEDIKVANTFHRVNIETIQRMTKFYLFYSIPPIHLNTCVLL